jgi:NADPH:quinone reductase-like Zn-dependent oxidoreductase
MRAVRLSEHGDTDVLSVEDVDRPEPAADELLVEVSAAGVNPVDTYFRDGSYEPVSLPFTPGVDFAGTVVETGGEVAAYEPGDGVFGTGVGNASRQGSYAEYLTVGTDTVAPLADGVDHTAAGGAPVAAATAWRALIGIAGLDPAERCLIHGGSGGVGHAAVQIAAAVNAHVITTARPDYHDAVSALGADVVLDYGRDDLAEAVMAAADGDVGGSGGGRSAGGPDGGVDVVLDHRLDDYLQFDTEVANPRASIVGIGENDPEAVFSDVNAPRGIDAGYTFMSLFNTPNLHEVLSGVSYLMETGALEIEVAHSYALEEAAAAQRAVMADSFLGKLVIEL